MTKPLQPGDPRAQADVLAELAAQEAADLDALTVEELRAKAKAADQATTGTKAELIARLTGKE